MISGIILIILALFFWFTKEPKADDKHLGLVTIFIKTFGPRGYVLASKVLATFIFIAAIAEFYKYFSK